MEICIILGGGIPVTSFSGNIDNLKTNGKWQVTNTATGTKPIVFGFLLEATVAGDYVCQKACSPIDGSSYIRTCIDRTGYTWSSWIRVDNFGCSTESELASLLGEGVFSTTSADTIFTPGLYRQTTTAGLPLNDAGYLLVLSLGSFRKQFFSSDNKINLYERVYKDDEWTLWKELQFVV